MVQDDDAVRTLTCTLLRQAGYSVVQAASGEEALRLATSRRLPAIDLVVSDVVMPGITGPQLADRLSTLRPGIRILYMSGYTCGELDPAIATSQPGFLQKPYTAVALLRAVREALAAS